MFSYRSKPHQLWDFFIIGLALFNCIYMPVELAFKTRNENMDGINLFIDILFIIDVVVSFRTTFLNEKEGEEICSTKVIAFNYLRGRFIIDFPSAIPVDLILQDESQGLELISLIKFVRVLRLYRMINYMNQSDGVKVSLKLIQVLLLLLVWVHLVACVWFYVITIEDQEDDSVRWVPPKEYALGTYISVYEMPQAEQYVNSLYVSVQMLTGNDVYPRGLLQMILVSIVIIIDALINANIFSLMAVYLQQIMKKSSKF